MRRLVNLVSIACTAGLVLWLVNQSFAAAVSFGIVIVAMLAILPVVWLGRVLLDAQPTIERAEWVTTFIHYGVFNLLAAALIEAIKLGLAAPVWPIPLPREAGLALMVISGVAMLLAVANLALRGLGAPFAVALSRRLAMDWLYAWTRNPMVLSGLAFLIAVGLWLRSTLFVLWVLLMVTPVMLLFLKVYEERELEIRFGEAYRAYRARTPMLWPRRPRNE